MAKKAQKKPTKQAAKPKAPKVAKAAADPKTAILDAALGLATSQGWAYTTLADIAREADMSLGDLRDYIDEKSDILVIFGRMIDKKTLEAVGEGDPSISPRDQLFDILMERFDVLNQYREPLISILDSFKSDPKQIVISCPHLGRSMSWMLEAAGLESEGFRGAARVAGLVAVYIKALHVWRGDNSADLSKTMAALDKDLARAEKLANTFGF